MTKSQATALVVFLYIGLFLIALSVGIQGQHIETQLMRISVALEKRP